MYIKIAKILLAVAIVSATINPSCALQTGFITFSDNQDINNKMLFLDKLSDCTKHKYHASPSGIYEIYGKKSNFCQVRWTVVNCNFPEGVYQEFARVQKHKTVERTIDQHYGIIKVIKDKDYRYLLDTGNQYCQNNYSNPR